MSVWVECVSINTFNCNILYCYFVTSYLYMIFSLFHFHFNFYFHFLISFSFSFHYYYALFIVYCYTLLFIVYCLLFIVYCLLLFIVCCLAVYVYCLSFLFIVYCLLFIVIMLFFIISMVYTICNIIAIKWQTNVNATSSKERISTCKTEGTQDKGFASQPHPTVSWRINPFYLITGPNVKRPIGARGTQEPVKKT
jgi:hypothetical protein